MKKPAPQWNMLNNYFKENIHKFSVMISHVKDVAKAHVLSLSNKRAGGRRLIVGSEVRSILELSQIMAKNIPRKKTS